MTFEMISAEARNEISSPEAPRSSFYLYQRLFPSVILGVGTFSSRYGQLDLDSLKSPNILGSSVQDQNPLNQKEEKEAKNREWADTVLGPEES